MDKFEDMLENLYQILDNDEVEDKIVLTKPEFKREGKKIYKNFTDHGPNQKMVGKNKSNPP